MKVILILAILGAMVGYAFYTHPQDHDGLTEEDRMKRLKKDQKINEK